MNFIIVLSGIFHTSLSLFVGIVFIFLTLSFLKNVHKNLNGNAELNKNNIAFSLYLSSSIFSVAWVMKGAIEPAITAFELVLRNPNTEFMDYLLILGIMLVQLILPGILAFVFVSIGIWIFTKLTKNIEEMEEITKNNIALGILLSTIIIVLILFIQPGINMTMNGLIPFPEIGINN